MLLACKVLSEDFKEDLSLLPGIRATLILCFLNNGTALSVKSFIYGKETYCLLVVGLPTTGLGGGVRNFFLACKICFYSNFSG